MTITLDDIVRSPREYVRRVQAGESIVITDAEEPVAELKPVNRASKSLRPFGQSAGEFTVPDDFDGHFYFASTPEEWECAMNEMASGGKKLPVLTDSAYDRESLYEDRL